MSTSVTEDLEIWELTIPGRVTLQVAGEYGRPRQLSAKGKGQRLRLTANDRRIAQEQIRHEQNDPFTNGMLIRRNRLTAEEIAAATTPVDPDEAPSDNELSDDELVLVFELEPDEFEPMVRSFSEINVRRLKALAVERDAKASQVVFLNEYIEEAYPIGGTTPTYEEMQTRPVSAV